MPTLNHRHQPSTASTASSTSSSSSSRPALQHILTNSPSNGVHLSRSTAPTSRQVRSHWFSHFVVNWRRSSRTSKFILAFSLTLVAIQVITTLAVLTVSWNMYCDRPLRIYLSVYILRLCLSCPLSLYLHFAPRRRQQSSSVDRAERGEIYAMTERTRPQSGVSARDIATPNLSPPPAVAFMASTTLPRPPLTDTPGTRHVLYRDTTLINWIDRAKSALDLFAVLWFIIGNYMLFTSTTCSETAVPLYYLSLVLIVYGYIILTVPILLCAAVIFCLPCVLVGMRLIHVEDGVDMGGASIEDIAKIPVFRFKSNSSSAATATAKIRKPNTPATISSTATNLDTSTAMSTKTSTTATANTDKSLTSTPGSTSGTRLESAIDVNKSAHSILPSGLFDRLWVRLGFNDPSSDVVLSHDVEHEILEIPNEQDQVCAICLSMYDDGDVLCKLWCNHHFHKTCVHQWLVLNSRCPMCKRDSRGKEYPLN